MTNDTPTLTIEDFAATLLAEKNSELLPLWLVTSDEAKQEALENLNKAFEEWKAMELRMKERREEDMNKLMQNVTIRTDT